MILRGTCVQTGDIQNRLCVLTRSWFECALCIESDCYYYYVSSCKTCLSSSLGIITQVISVSCRPQSNTGTNSTNHRTVPPVYVYLLLCRSPFKLNLLRRDKSDVRLQEQKDDWTICSIGGEGREGE